MYYSHLAASGDRHVSDPAWPSPRSAPLVARRPIPQCSHYGSVLSNETCGPPSSSLCPARQVLRHHRSLCFSSTSLDCSAWRFCRFGLESRGSSIDRYRRFLCNRSRRRRDLSSKYGGNGDLDSQRWRLQGFLVFSIIRMFIPITMLYFMTALLEYFNIYVTIRLCSHNRQMSQKTTVFSTRC
jgi:hypothetical protein